jgi:hypothetical protein
MATQIFSPTKITDRRDKELCFKCDEQFIPGHCDICKRRFTIELIDDDDKEEGPMISLHVHHRTEHGAHISALLDSGSTYNFMDSAAATRAGLALT